MADGFHLKGALPIFVPILSLQRWWGKCYDRKINRGHGAPVPPRSAAYDDMRVIKERTSLSLYVT